MLQALSLSGIECFGPGPLAIDDLRENVFIFGGNGSGKTSISRALDDSSRKQWDAAQWRGSQNGDVLVYNKPFANSVIENYSRLEGVFLLGEHSQELHDELDELISPRGARADTERKYFGCQENLGKATAALEEARKTLEKTAWRKKSEMAAALEPAFKGYNAAKDKFATQLLAVDDASDNTSEDEDALVRDAASIFDAAAQIEERFLELPLPSVDEIVGSNLLGTRIVGSADARLSDLADTLKNHDWINQGRDYLEHSEGKCPFCQQEAPDNLEGDLEELFDRSYKEKTMQLAEFARSYNATLDDIVRSAERIPAETDKFLETDRLKAVVPELRNAILSTKRDLQGKLGSPANIVQLPDLTPHVDAVNDVIRDANTEVNLHNERVRKRSEEHPRLVDRCWRYFAQTHASSEIAVYRAEEQRLRPQIEGLTKTLDKTNTELNNVSLRIQELENQLVSSTEVINRINRLLASTGFTSFKLAPSEDVKDGYTMVRERGVVEEGTLSEGEQTFISFLYFYYLVENTRVEDSTRPLVVVIDDPISSMDSDVMLVVSVLVKTLMERTKDQRSRLSQVIVLTHNVHFHKEVTHQQNQSLDEKRIFYLIRKYPEAPHALKKYDKNPIQSAYGRLWQEVREATDNPGDHSPVGLENIMRRILETYFSVLGDVGQANITNRFSGEDMLICRSLYLWAHGGSHSLFDDNDFSPTAYSTDMYLRVFREIFEKTNQAQHYRMMMNLPEPAVEASSSTL